MEQDQSMEVIIHRLARGVAESESRSQRIGPGAAG